MIQRDPNAPVPVLTDYVSIEPVAKIALSPAEAADAVGVSVDTIRRAIDSGDLVARRMRGRRAVRIFPEDLRDAFAVIPSTGTYAAGLV